MESHRIEKHKISKQHPSYDVIVQMSHLTNNLYNHANFIVRQNFFYNKNEKGASKYLSFYEMDKILRRMGETNYQQLPKQTAQQTLKVLHQNWMSFFASVKDYKQHPSKYLGRPKPPKYRKSGGLFHVILTNQQCKLKGGQICFPKAFNGLILQPHQAEHLTDVKIIPKASGDFEVSVGYKTTTEPLKTPNNRVLSIDLGLDNFVTMVTNTGLNPVILNGKGLKSKNQYFNSQLLKAKLELERCQNGVDYGLQRKMERVNTKMHMATLYESDFEQFSALLQQHQPKRKDAQYTSKRMARLYEKRHHQMLDYFHKTSRFIVNYCIEHDISQVVIGHNKGQKVGNKIKHFTQIPIFRFIDILEYKLRSEGILLFKVNESYTSGTSFLDDELPNANNYDKSRRIQRGLFQSYHGCLNSDVNGALQIMKKWDKDVVVTFSHNYFNPVKTSNM